MQFIQATFLYGLAALAVPVIVHLIFRWQTRQVDLGTLRFLSEIVRHNARRKRVQRWLLLALRLACVAALAALFARPFLLALAPTAEGRLTVVLVDRSATMELRQGGHRLIDRAVARARELVAGAGDKGSWEIALFDNRVLPLKRSADETALDALRRAPESLYGATDYGAAIAWARDICLKAPPGRKDVYLLTDLQRSGVGWTTSDALHADVRLHVEDLGKPLVQNASVSAVAASAALVKPGKPVTVRATISNQGPLPLDDVPVILTLASGDRTRRASQSARLGPSAAADVEFDLEGLEAGLWQGMVQVEVDDELAFDNQRYLGVLAAPPRRVVVLDGAAGGAPELAESFYLEAALRLAPPGETWEESPFDPVIVDVGQTGVPSLDDADLVVLANVGALPVTEADRLAAFVRAGHGMLVFTGENVTPESSTGLAAAGLAPGTITGVARAADLPLRWRRWDNEHPLFEPFREPQYGDLRRIAFDAHTLLSPDPAARVLAEFRDGAPALVEHRLGSGRVLWFLSGCGRAWSDWPHSRLFVPLVHQMLADLAGLTGGGPVRSLVLEGTASSDSSPGVFQRDGHWEVVNTSPRESETDRLTSAELAARYGAVLAGEDDQAVEAGEERAALGNELRDDEIWPWVALVLLGLLSMESFLANRTTV